MVSSWLETLMFGWIVKQFPPYITPNQLTAVALLQTFLQLVPTYLKTIGFESVWILITYQVLAFSSVMFDCFDGEHARNTNQCSKLGAILDHFIDAGTTTLKGFCGVVFCKVQTKVGFVLGLVCPAAIYHARLLNDLSTKSANPADTISVIIILCTAVSVAHNYEPSNKMDLILVVTMMILTVVHLYETMINMKVVYSFIAYISQEILCAMLYMFGFLTAFEYGVTAALCQWNSNGLLSIHFETKNYDACGYKLDSLIITLATCGAKKLCGIYGVLIVHFLVAHRILYSFCDLTNFTVRDIAESLKFNEKKMTLKDETK